MRKSFIIHKDSLSVLDDLTNEQCGELFRAIKAHQLDELIDLSPLVKIAFSPFRNQFYRDDEKYEKTCKVRADAGSKGGKQKVANASKCKQTVANLADSVSKSKSKSKSDSKNKEILIPDGINAVAWNEWVDYRKTKKKVISQAAATKQFKLLTNYALDVQQQIINQSIQNDYQGLFEPRGSNENNQRSHQSGRPSAVDRVREANERARAQRAATREAGGNMADVDGHLRQQPSESVRDSNARSVGITFEGDYSKAN